MRDVSESWAPLNFTLTTRNIGSRHLHCFMFVKNRRDAASHGIVIQPDTSSYRLAKADPVAIGRDNAELSYAPGFVLHLGENVGTA
jgi:hypothetical protein